MADKKYLDKTGMTEMWSNYCPLYKEAACMRSITAQTVLEAASAQLARKHGLN